MSYSELVNDTIRITAKNWWLWIFGFFVSASDAGSSMFQFTKNLNLGHRHHFSNLDFLPALAAGIILLIFVAAIIYLILKLISEGSLIVAVRDIKKEHPTNLSAAAAEGVKFFWRLIGIWFTFVVISIVSFVIAAIPVVIAFLLHWVLGVLALIVVVPIWIAFLVATDIIAAWAFRYAVIDDRGFVDAIGEGFTMLRKYLGQSIVVALISFGSHIVIGIVTFIVVLLIGVPFLIAGAINLWMGLIPGIVIGFCLLVVIHGFSGTYFSSLWTLAFLQIKELSPPPAAA
jgi:hypothetical protein